MQVIIKKIEELFKANNNSPVTAIDKLPQAGSDRFYFRISTGEQTYIATYGPNVPENESFIYFSQKFREKNICTPQVFYVSEDKTIYIQEDFGDTSLLNILEAEGFSDNVYSLYKQSLSKLAELQIKAHEVVDYSKCLTNREFGKEAIMADLLYFKFYFLDALAKPYDKQLLIHDFEALSNYLAHTEHKYFMFRDFQSRNIMVTPNNEVHFIDYQGGMNGAPQYDVASMLWQARAGLSEEWKGALLNDYMDAFEKSFDKPNKPEIYNKDYIYKNEHLKDYKITVWNSENSDLPNNMNDNIAVDKKGIIWLTVDQGLVTFDGEKFKSLSVIEFIKISNSFLRIENH